MVTVTNDGWFMDTAELDQHLDSSRFRSIETRLPLARAANTGISSIIDPTGRVTHVLATPNGKRREIAGVLVGRLDFVRDWRPTLYVRLGDWWGIPAAVATVGLMTAAAARWTVRRRAARRTR
jgi:apolipoprotein N-acyltransferase